MHRHPLLGSGNWAGRVAERAGRDGRVVEDVVPTGLRIALVCAAGAVPFTSRPEPPPPTPCTPSGPPPGTEPPDR